MQCRRQDCLSVSGLAAQNSPIITNLECLDLVNIFQLLGLTILFQPQISTQIIFIMIRFLLYVLEHMPEQQGNLVFTLLLWAVMVSYQGLRYCEALCSSSISYSKFPLHTIHFLLKPFCLIYLEINEYLGERHRAESLDLLALKKPINVLISKKSLLL